MSVEIVASEREREREKERESQEDSRDEKKKSGKNEIMRVKFFCRERKK